MGALELTTALTEASEEIKNKLSWAAIGLAKLDYEDFVKDDYFRNGIVYIDENKDSYKLLNFTSMGFFPALACSIPTCILNLTKLRKKVSREI
jgi:hypothetical protein